MQGHTDAGAREARRGREADAGAGDARRGHARACEESLLHGGDLLGRRAADYVHSEIAQREIPRESPEFQELRVFRFQVTRDGNLKYIFFVLSSCGKYNFAPLRIAGSANLTAMTTSSYNRSCSNKHHILPYAKHTTQRLRHSDVQPRKPADQCNSSTFVTRCSDAWSVA